MSNGAILVYNNGDSSGDKVRHLPCWARLQSCEGKERGSDGGKGVNPFLHNPRDGIAVLILKLSVLLWCTGTRFRQE